MSAPAAFVPAMVRSAPAIRIRTQQRRPLADPAADRTGFSDRGERRATPPLVQSSASAYRVRAADVKHTREGRESVLVRGAGQCGGTRGGSAALAGLASIKLVCVRKPRHRVIRDQTAALVPRACGLPQVT